MELGRMFAQKLMGRLAMPMTLVPTVQCSTCEGKPVRQSRCSRPHRPSSNGPDCRLVSPPDNFGDGIVECGGERRFPQFEVRDEFDVKLLDQEMESSNFAQQKVAFVKIEVEGFECLVFRGGKKLLAQHLRLIQTEIWGNGKMQDCHSRACMKMFTDAGYKVAGEVQCKSDSSDTVPGAPTDKWMCLKKGEDGKGHLTAALVSVVVQAAESDRAHDIAAKQTDQIVIAVVPWTSCNVFGYLLSVASHCVTLTVLKSRWTKMPESGRAALHSHVLKKVLKAASRVILAANCCFRCFNTFHFSSFLILKESQSVKCGFS